MSARSRRATGAVFVLFLTGLAAGAFTGATAVSRVRDPYEAVDLLVRVYSTIERGYVEEIDPDTLVSAAIEGMVDALDEHSRWMSADEYAALMDDSEGGYDGIGVQLHAAEEGVRVARVLPGSPASRDGIALGDLILAVDGQEVGAAPIDEVTDWLRGPRGAPTELTIVRTGEEEPRVVRTIRDRVRAPIAHAARIGEVAYVRLSQFQEGAGEELASRLDDLLAPDQPPPRGLILDLRDNQGGLLREAVAVADLFLEEGPIVSTRGRLPEENGVHEATAGAIDPDLDMVVLVNGLTASASEIVAGALQDTGRAVLVGTRTYGKGSVQTIYENRDHSALKLTIGQYFTPSGQPVAAHEGRSPDVWVDYPVPEGPRSRLRARLEGLAVDDAEREHLLALVDAIPGRDPASMPLIPWDEPLADRLPSDPQLLEALALLNE